MWKIIHEVFKLPNDSVSLPDILQLYNVKEVAAIQDYPLNTPVESVDYDYYCEPMALFCDSSYTIKRSTFSTCFNEFTNSSPLHETFNLFSTDYETKKVVQMTPCADLEKFPSCTEYCNWHKTNIDGMQHERYKQFISIMRFALPQSKILIPGFQNEESLAGT